jgi:2-dehydro-3-deoxyphosphogluconate aldolase/(4S)-4-hydroxy-2-oxoglutarate aldolase
LTILFIHFLKGVFVDRTAIKEQVIKNGVVAVIRIKDADVLMKVIEAIRAGGIKSIEITTTVPNAIGMIEITKREFGDSIILGVGTVLNAQTAKEAIEAGSEFVVSPVLKKEIVETRHQMQNAVFPGAFSPTEALYAHELGADIIKIFPADVVGMAFFKAIKAPMPQLDLMPTGGVSLDNAGDWLKAGACAVGIGGALLDKQALSEKRFQVLTDNAKRVIANIEKARNN